MTALSIAPTSSARHLNCGHWWPHLSDTQIDQPRRGGHDPVKIHAAFAEAVRCQGRPTVVLAMTMKGYGMGAIAQGRMTTHQQRS